MESGPHRVHGVETRRAVPVAAIVAARPRRKCARPPLTATKASSHRTRTAATHGQRVRRLRHHLGATTRVTSQEESRSCHHCQHPRKVTRHIGSHVGSAIALPSARSRYQLPPRRDADCHVVLARAGVFGRVAGRVGWVRWALLVRAGVVVGVGVVVRSPSSPARGPCIRASTRLSSSFRGRRGGGRRRAVLCCRWWWGRRAPKGDVVGVAARDPGAAVGERAVPVADLQGAAQAGGHGALGPADVEHGAGHRGQRGGDRVQGGVRAVLGRGSSAARAVAGA